MKTLIAALVATTFSIGAFAQAAMKADSAPMKTPMTAPMAAPMAAPAPMAKAHGTMAKAHGTMAKPHGTMAKSKMKTMTKAASAPA